MRDSNPAVETALRLTKALEGYEDPYTILYVNGGNDPSPLKAFAAPVVYYDKLSESHDQLERHFPGRVVFAHGEDGLDIKLLFSLVIVAAPGPVEALMRMVARGGRMLIGHAIPGVADAMRGMRLEAVMIRKGHSLVLLTEDLERFTTGGRVHRGRNPVAMDQVKFYVLKQL